MTSFKMALPILLLSTAAFAAGPNSRPSNAAIVPDNVIVCGASAGCTNKAMFGRNYKVLSTPKFTVMVSVSREGNYTRADVSIANNTTYPLNLSPQDFRVEVLEPKAKVLLYQAPESLLLPPEPTPKPTAAAAIPEVVSPSGEITPPAPPTIDELYLAKKKQIADQEAAEKAAAQKHLPATPIAANETLRGRVYFERDNKARVVKIVLPVAGQVFEFPYALK